MDNNKDAKNYARKQLRRLKKSEERNRRMYVIFSIILSVINISVLVMASFALGILLANSKIKNEDMSFRIVMAAFAAAVTILIFIINVTIFIFRGVTRVDAYRDACHAIEKEYMAFSLKVNEYKKEKQREEILNAKCQKIFEEATKTKSKGKKKISKIILKAISGGNND